MGRFNIACRWHLTREYPRADLARMNPSVVKWRAFLDDIDLRQSLDKVEEEVDNWVASATRAARKFSHERGFSTDENVGGNENAAWLTESC